MKLKITFLLTLFMMLTVNISSAQEKMVSGVVRESLGPIPGVSVLIKGTTLGTQTDLDGKYSIKVKPGQVLQFSYVGMTTKEITVGKSSSVNVTMQTEAKELQNVVVNVGYQSVKKSKVTGSVTVVDSKVIENKPIASFDQLLQGAAAGLVVQAGSGQPGSAASVYIRGTHSIVDAGGSPLYILDGMQITGGDFAALNPNDFENVSVLKDAAATSIYGSRATNGVILITSKKGKYNAKTTLNYKSQFGVSQIGVNPVTMMNAEQKMIYENYLTPGKYSDADLAYAQKNSTNWQDVFFRQGYLNTHELSASGGSEKTRFFTSLSYFDQQGISLRSDLKRFNYRANLENKISDKARFGTNISLGFTKSNSISNQGALSTGNPFLAAYMSSPLTTPYDANGNFNSGPTVGGYNKIGGNNLEDLMVNKRNNNSFKLVGNVYGEVDFLKYFSYRADLGIDYADNRSESARNPNTFFGSTVQPGLRGSYSQGNGYQANILMNQKLKFETTFADKHNVSVMALTEYYKRHINSSSFVGYGLNDKIWSYAAAITPGTTSNGLIPGVGGTDYSDGLFSYFMNGNYSYDSRYTFDATFRRDASSKFSRDNKWGTFWALGANWNITAESFMQKVDWINELRLRASYGTQGNQNAIGMFNDENTWGTASYNGVAGVTPASMANNELKWETSNKLNTGLDFGMFKRRLTGSVDYYNELVTNLFIEQNLSAQALQSSLYVNAGSMSNKGVDLNLKGYVFRSKDFAWDLYGNSNYNLNTIEDLGQVTEYEDGTSIVREGLSYGSHYIQGWAGVNPANGQPLYYDKAGNITTTYSTDNYTANWGSFKPVYTGGFGTNVYYKGFDLNVFFTYAAEYYRFNNQSFFLENSASSWTQYNQSTNMLNIWRNPGDVTDIQGADYTRQFSSKDIEDSSYTRLRNITLGYSFPQITNVAKPMFTGIKLYVQAQNLYTWTNFTGFDPEDSNNIASYEYPTPRTFTLGLDLKF
jgi:TonB-linked SusC/RagA family outer membrane protein